MELWIANHRLLNIPVKEERAKSSENKKDVCSETSEINILMQTPVSSGKGTLQQHVLLLAHISVKFNFFSIPGQEREVVVLMKVNSEIQGA